MLKIGFIGHGSITSAHHGGINQLIDEGYELSAEAYCDIRESQLQNLGTARVYTEIDEFIAKEKGKLDIADICLPTCLHCSTAVKALNSGFHVLVEKPMALSYEDCILMCEAAKKNNRYLMVAQCVRFSDFIQTAKKYIEDKTFGAVKTACFKRNGGTPRWGWNDWFIKEEMSGGALLDMHVHDVDALNYLFGIPEAVSSGAAKIIPGDGYGIVVTNYYYKNGLFTHSTTDWTSDHDVYSNRSMRVDFDKGYIISAGFGDCFVFRAVNNVTGEVTELSPAKPTSDYYKEIKYFTDCILSGKPVAECLPESTAESIRIALTEGVSASKNGARMVL